MAIRTVIMAPEAVEGTAATGTYIFMRVMKWTPANDAKLDIPRETTGSTIVTQHPRPGTRNFNFSGQARAYFDLSVHWFAMMFGAPVVAGVSGATGAFDHTFKPGGITPLPYTVKWKQTSKGNVIWRQATGCKLKTLKGALVGTMGQVFDFTGHGQYATSISAPTVPGDTTAAYNQPMSLDQQALTLNASPWKKPKKIDWTVDNGLTPDWSIQASRDADRFKLGDTTMEGSFESFFDAYVGSAMEAQDSASAALAQIVNLILDVVPIGTGTPTVPKYTATFPSPYVHGATEDDTNTDAEEKFSTTFAYQSALASLASFVFRNELASTVYVGS